MSAGANYTVLLRSDGCVLPCGTDYDGRCQIPVPEPGIRYIGNLMPRGTDLVLQLNFVCEDDEIIVTCSSVAAQEVLRLNASASDLAWNTHQRIARELKVNLQNLRLILPEGDLLAPICRENPVATVASVADVSRQKA